MILKACRTLPLFLAVLLLCHCASSGPKLGPMPASRPSGGEMVVSIVPINDLTCIGKVRRSEPPESTVFCTNSKGRAEWLIELRGAARWSLKELRAVEKDSANFLVGVMKHSGEKCPSLTQTVLLDPKQGFRKMCEVSAPVKEGRLPKFLGSALKVSHSAGTAQCKISQRMKAFPKACRAVPSSPIAVEAKRG